MKKLFLILLILFIAIWGSLSFTKDSFDTKGDVAIYVLDIDQGDAILIKTSTENIVIDTGDIYQENSKKGGTNKNIVEILKSKNVKKIDKLIISHPHADHLGGIINLMDNFPIDTIYDNGEMAKSKIYRDFLKKQKLGDNKAKHYYHINNEEHNLLNFGTDKSGNKITFLVLSPTKEMIQKANSTDDKDFNNNSIVGKLEYGKFSMLFTGDIEAEAEKYLVEKYKNDLKSTILKVPHHGSSTSSTIKFLDYVNPKAAIISSGKNSRYYHPHEKTIKNYEKLGIKIYATNGNNKFKNGDNDNTIAIFPNIDGNFTIEKIKE